MSDDSILLCVPKGALHVFGATLDRCSICRCEVWVSPSSRRLLAANPLMTILCPVCLLPRIEADPAPKFEPPQADQLLEIFGHFNRN